MENLINSFNTPIDIPAEIYKKVKKLRNAIERFGLDAILLKRRDNFSWFSCGETSEVVLSDTYGSGIIVITKNNVFLVAYTMDIDRLLDESLSGCQFIEPIRVKWFEKTPDVRALELCGEKVAADFWLENVKYMLQEIYALHYPLEEWEVTRLRYAGRVADEIFYELGKKMVRGMTDYDVKAEIVYQCAIRNALPEVILVGVNERISKYKHCIASGKKLEGTVLIHPALQVSGLHANVARMFCFDEIPDELAKKHEVTNRIFAEAAASSKVGTSISEIMGLIKDGYNKSGYELDWQGHFKGGQSGYMLVDEGISNQDFISERHAFDWFITLAGAKTEELVLCTPGIEVCSLTGLWNYEELIIGNEKIKVPAICQIG